MYMESEEGNPTADKELGVNNEQLCTQYLCATPFASHDCAFLLFFFSKRTQSYCLLPTRGARLRIQSEKEKTTRSGDGLNALSAY